MEGEAGQELITKVQFLQKTVFDLVIGEASILLACNLIHIFWCSKYPIRS